MKKWTALLLTLCLCFSLLPGTALAADGTANTGKTSIFDALDGLLSLERELKDVLTTRLYVAAKPDAGLDGDSVVDVGTSGVTLYLPGKADAGQLFLRWDDESIALCDQNGKACESGSTPIAPAGKSVTYQVSKGRAFAYVTIQTVQGSTGVEPMFLTIDESLGAIASMNGDPKHETVCYGQAKLGSVNKAISIKGRGNYTWKWDKKPYNITFYKTAAAGKWEKDGETLLVDGVAAKKDKAELIDGVKAKKWTLLANYTDNSLLRNKIALDLAEAMGVGLPSRFVDLWMNGRYLGNYLLTPKNDYQAPDKGYVLEIDNYREDEEGDPQFKIPGMLEIGSVIPINGCYNRITVKDIGDDAADDGVDAAAVEKYFLAAWDALRDDQSETYQNYFDMDSWAKMYLMYEASKTYDSYAGSLLMHRDALSADDKLIAGPAWDYDTSFGRTGFNVRDGISLPAQLNAQGWFNDSVGLAAMDQPVSLLQELGKHESFLRRVAAIYNKYQSDFDGIVNNVDAQKTLLRGSALMNNARWGTNSPSRVFVVAPDAVRLLGTGKYALQYQLTTTWDNYVYNLREFADKRTMWLSDHLSVSEPAGVVTRETLTDGSVLFRAAVTAGDNVSYQWQSSSDGEAWKDIAGASAANYVAADAAAEMQYRCVLRIPGPVIRTTHGGRVPLFGEAILEA